MVCDGGCYGVEYDGGGEFGRYGMLFFFGFGGIFFSSFFWDVWRRKKGSLGEGGGGQMCGDGWLRLRGLWMR